MFIRFLPPYLRKIFIKLIFRMLVYIETAEFYK
nr:MAG TPA: hypothetical protein [Caudoviricetes sp.]